MRCASQHDLVEAFTLANNQGWRTFSNKVFRALCRKDSPERNAALHNFIMGQIKCLHLEDYDTDVIKESVALLIQALRPLPKISYLTIKEFQDSFHFFTKKERFSLDVINEGKDFDLNNLEWDFIEADEDKILAEAEEREQLVLKEAESFLMRHMPGFYNEFYEYMMDVCGDSSVLFNQILHITCLLIALLIYQDNKQKVDQQIKSILSLKG